MTELDKLEAYLKEHEYEYERFDNTSGIPNFHQIVVYHKSRVDDERIRMWDAVYHPYSIGYDEGLLEVMGTIVDDIVNDEEYWDSVVGWLTAEDIIKVLEK